jgi:hypothetical protein
MITLTANNNHSTVNKEKHIRVERNTVVLERKNRWQEERKVLEENDKC